MSWEIDNEDKLVSEKCPEMEKEGKDVVLENNVVGKIITLLNKYPDLEWGAYLIGEEQKDKFLIKDLTLMKQEVTGTTVEFVEEDFPKNCVGWIHSHNSMDTFLSKTDVKTAMLYKVSIVVNNALNFVCRVKKQLPCGRVTLVPSKVILQGIDVDTSKIVEKPKKESIVIVDQSFQNICPVCGCKLSRRKSKLAYCPHCRNFVHRRCFNEEWNMCANCVEMFSKDEKERSRDLWREYFNEDYLDFYY